MKKRTRALSELLAQKQGKELIWPYKWSYPAAVSNYAKVPRYVHQDMPKR